MKGDSFILPRWRGSLRLHPDRRHGRLAIGPEPLVGARYLTIEVKRFRSSPPPDDLGNQAAPAQLRAIQRGARCPQRSAAWRLLLVWY
jgi:hypothetical protein